MQLLQDIQHHADDLLGTGNIDTDGVEPEVQTAVRTVVVFSQSATSTMSITSVAEIPDLVLFLSWLLLLKRQAGDEQIQFQWGSQLSGDADTLFPIPGNADQVDLASNQSISDLIVLVADLVRESDGMKRPRLGEHGTLFFHDIAKQHKPSISLDGSQAEQKVNPTSFTITLFRRFLT